jgi:hypothetical protein
MNPEVIIKLSKTTSEGVVMSEATPAPAPLEELPAMVGEVPPAPSETTIETVTGSEELPVPLPLDQLETAASEEDYAPAPMEKIVIGEIPEPITVTELAAITGELSIEELPKPEELDILAVGAEQKS